MDEQDQILDTHTLNLEAEIETALRPQSLAEFIGQHNVVENLSVFIQAAKNRSEALDHVLFSGPPGLGKTTLASLIANELEVGMHATSGPTLEKSGDLVSILTNLAEGDVLFIDEIHRMPRAIQEYLYSAMEDFHVDILLDTGPTAKSVRVSLKRFTLIGATTREGQLSAPFRARFGVQERLVPYPDSDLQLIVNRTSRVLQTAVSEDAAAAIARRSRGTPRITNRLVRRLRDVAEVKGDGSIDAQIASEGFRMLGIDDHGLTEMDRQILKFLADSEVPVGLKTLAIAIGEEEPTIEDSVEPHLIREGLIQKTPRGRTVTDKGRSVI
ncbi:MAG: Holliday junction branch migration DNA helicase RuvB [Planctomycetes bacterium]|nr:Holliday junction branch migration DNA helicase RuvB [Planctomycetota bacterium]